MKENTLYYGDCLEVISKWDDESVDLIYLDPPFNSKANYNILFGTQRNGGDKNGFAQLTAFTDTWEWDENAAKRVDLIKSAIAHPAHRAICAISEIYPDGSGMFSYLSYMAQRLAEAHRILKSTGTIYLHCDPTASHYLKIIMDQVFGSRNFRNEIVWCYTGPSRAAKFFPRKHDYLLFYTKSDKWVFNAKSVRVPYVKLETGKTSGIFRKARTLSEKGKVPESWWTKFSPVGRIEKERLGYPTQKPLALLKRIVLASSNEGDLVLDPFCGCGTTIEAAHLLKRKWIGIDISAYAIEVVRRERMKDMRIELAGVPKDLREATHFAKENPFDFEKWAVTRIPGFAPNKVQRGDSGIDGRALIYGEKREHSLCIAQVKGGKPSIDALRAFLSTIAEGATAIGVFITLHKWDTPAVRQCVAKAGVLSRGETEFNRLLMYSIDEYFQGFAPRLPTLAHPRTGESYQAELSTKSLLSEWAA